MNTEQEQIKTGTTTVGIYTSEGIVLAADKRATAGYFIANKKIEKVYAISDNVAITIAGLVSDLQLITKLMKAELKLQRIRTGKDPTVKEATNLLATIVYHNIRKFSTIPGITGFLVGGYDNSGCHLYEIGVDGSVTEHDEYAADGSGMMMAIGVLDTLYKKDIKLNDAVKLAVKAINASLQRDAATGEGVDVVTITKQGVKKVFHKTVSVDLNA